MKKKTKKPKKLTSKTAIIKAYKEHGLTDRGARSVHMRKQDYINLYHQYTGTPKKVRYYKGNFKIHTVKIEDGKRKEWTRSNQPSSWQTHRKKEEHADSAIRGLEQTGEIYGFEVESAEAEFEEWVSTEREVEVVKKPPVKKKPPVVKKPPEPIETLQEKSDRIAKSLRAAGFSAKEVVEALMAI